MKTDQLHDEKGHWKVQWNGRLHVSLVYRMDHQIAIMYVLYGGQEGAEGQKKLPPSLSPRWHLPPRNWKLYQT